MGRKDPVKKNMDLLHKPQTHRNRKRESKNNPPVERELHHPLHRPYERSKDWQRDIDLDDLDEE